MRHETAGTGRLNISTQRQAKAFRTAFAKTLSLTILIVAAFLWFSVPSVLAQGSAFTYQGRLQDGGTPANGNYDLQFTLWNSVSGGTQVGSVQTLNTVAVSGGVFTVSLDFGANAFPGATRFLEISVRPSGSGSFTLLTPRQPITSTPYAVRSLTATTADSVPVAGVPAGSGSYIQNQSAAAQTGSFNISGDGIIGGNVGIGTANPLYKLHVEAGNSISAVYGHGTDTVGVSGVSQRSSGVVGYSASGTGVDGDTSTGYAGVYGSSASTTGVYGYSNTGTGVGGRSNTGWAGYFEGSTYISGNGIIGGRVGIGTTNPLYKLHVEGGIGLAVYGTSSNSVGTAIWGSNSSSGSGVYGSSSSGYGLQGSSSSGDGVYGHSTSGLAGNFDGKVGISTLGSAGATSLCRNVSNVIASCSSSLRYKTDVRPFPAGLDLINRLKPISFTWKQGGLRDLGLGAEDVEAVEPLLVTYNTSGEVEGVKYDRLTAVLVNAIKEQQAQIAELRANLRAQRSEINKLTRLGRRHRSPRARR